MSTFASRSFIPISGVPRFNVEFLSIVRAFFRALSFVVSPRMATIQRKLGRRYQRYTSARQTYEGKDDDPKEVWERMIKMPDVVSAMAIDMQTNDIFPLYGLNNIARNDLNTYCREYIDMAIDFSLNINPSDEVKILRLRSQEREIVIAYDNGSIFVIVQTLSKEKSTAPASLLLDL
jgi:hypothetical protein